MTPTQPSLLDAVDPPPAMPRSTTPAKVQKPAKPTKVVKPTKPTKVVKPTKPTKRTIDASACQCGTFILPGDFTAHDGHTYCRACWAALPEWMRGTVPISQWPRGWRKIAGVR